MLRSVIMTIMKRPMSSDANPIFRVISVGFMKKMMLIAMRISPSIFARICG